MDSRRAAIVRLAVFGAIVGGIFLAGIATGITPTPEEVEEFGDDLGAAAYVAWIPLFVLANFVITWPILAGAAGLLFGTPIGFPLSVAAVIVASVVQMGISRRLAGKQRERLLPPRTRPIEDFLARHGAVAVMQARIVPGLPWGLVNYSAGLTRLSFASLALGTLVGGVPKVFAYTALGGSLTDLRSPEAILAIALLVVLALVGALFLRHQIAAARV